MNEKFLKLEVLRSADELGFLTFGEARFAKPTERVKTFFHLAVNGSNPHFKTLTERILLPHTLFSRG